jgi:hypothetical protein
VNHGGHCENQEHVKTTPSKGGMTLCNITQSLVQVNQCDQCEKQKTSTPYYKFKYLGATSSQGQVAADVLLDWPEAHIKTARMTLTINFDRNLNSFQLPNTAPPLRATASY